MVDPYTFLHHIRACKFVHIRSEWAALALSLYYPDEGHAFDVRLMPRWIPVDQAVGIGALAWACGRRGPQGYQLAEVEILDRVTRDWLVLIAAGSEVAAANKKAGLTMF